MAFHHALSSPPPSASLQQLNTFCSNNSRSSGIHHHPASVVAVVRKFCLCRRRHRHRHRRSKWLFIEASQLSAAKVTSPTPALNKSALLVSEAVSEDEFRAAARLRVRSFYDFQPSFGIQDHKRYLAEREFEALKERISGERIGFRRVSCINASLPLSKNLPDELCDVCKFTDGVEERVVVGTLDLNQCVRLPDEITGKKPEGIGADFARAYLSNVCVANELRQNGLGLDLVVKSELTAQNWGITDLYVHVAIDNEGAKKLYMKCGFMYENDEPAWQARFLDRPRRILLWKPLPASYEL